MDKRKVGSVKGVFSTESLTTYKGNPFLNLNFLAVAFLYDFPTVAGNPEKLYNIIKKSDQNIATDSEKLILEVLESRLSSFSEGKEIAEIIKKLTT